MVQGQPRTSTIFRTAWALPGAALLLALAVFLAYRNSFSGIFLFDDIPSLVDNPGLRRLWPLWMPHSADETGLTVSGRPLAFLTFALNYAAGGLNPWGYHLVNVGIHLAAALCLLGVVRRTLLSPVLGGRYADGALPVAFAASLLWAVHPLQTESVTYIVQRVESLASLFYLLTFYCFLRARDSHRPTGWSVACVAACLCGMLSKEIVATAPVMLLVFDRIFFAGSFAAALRKRKGFYFSLALTWIPLGLLVASLGGRGGTAGASPATDVYRYACTQLGAVAHYLRLAVWPEPLVLDYGKTTVAGLSEVLPQAVLILLLLAATGVALWRRPPLGFLGLWFFGVLAPSSSVIPVATQAMTEHRVYLALAALTTLAALGGVEASRRRAWGGIAAAALLVAVAGALVWATVRRNEDYRSAEAIWAANVAARPENLRGHMNLGHALLDRGAVEEALRHYAQALALGNGAYEIHLDMAARFARKGFAAEAEAHFREALRLEPRSADTRTNLGLLLLNQGRIAEAKAQFEEALRLRPGHPDAHFNLGNARMALGDPAGAIASFEQTLRYKPGRADAHYNIGNAWAALENPENAIAAYREALRYAPAYFEAHFNLGNVLAVIGRREEAAFHLRQALALARASGQPDGVRDAEAALARYGLQ